MDIAFCLACHEFRNSRRDRYPDHTHHPATVKLDCSACHRQMTKDIFNPGNLDIHSYGYFLLHTENCYDPLGYKACSGCHEERGEAWARQTVEGWREPVTLDH